MKIKNLKSFQLIHSSIVIVYNNGTIVSIISGKITAAPSDFVKSVVHWQNFPFDLTKLLVTRI